MKLKFLTLAGVLCLLFSCKKGDDTNNNNNNGGNPPPDTTVSAADKVKDSTLLYSRDIYLWYSHIPSTYNPRIYADPDAIMTNIRQYSIEPGFNVPVDRWSFAAKKVDWDNTSNGTVQDFGMNVFFIQEGDLRVRFVEAASPAGLAGIDRGWRITKFNGSTNITTSNATLIVNAVYLSASSSFTFLKPDGSSVDITLNSAPYQEHPIFFDSVYTAGPKKLGYMVFNSFLGDTVEIKNEFQRVFDEFTAANVDEVAIDLRYNGGGYVSLQEYLADYLVNSTGAGQVLMNQEFNDKYAQFNETTYISKKGSLNLSRVFFIVSQNTASASELVINNLKPFMNVVLVGPSKTYGKPVGYFPIPVGDWYIFPVSFRSTNRNGEGNYFNGFALDNTVADGLDKDWGDPDESCLASVLKYVSTGAFRPEPSQMVAESPEVAGTHQVLDARMFKGTVGNKKIFH